MQPSETLSFGFPSLDDTKRLLKHVHLPIEDLTEGMLSHFIGLYVGAQLVAVGGIEPYGAIGFLRSMATAPDHQKKGYAGKVLRELEDRARRSGITHLYLLTETAENYFSHKGFMNTPRDQAPESIRNTSQFQGICPQSATFMSKPLGAT